RVEELDRGAVLLQKLIRVVEVLTRLRDDAPGVVVEVLVLVAGNHPAWLEALDDVDRLPPAVATSVCRLPEVLVHPRCRSRRQPRPNRGPARVARCGRRYRRAQRRR